MSALVVTSACEATTAPRSLEPLEPLDSDTLDSETLDSETGASSPSSGPGSAVPGTSGWTDPAGVASLAPDVSAAVVAASAEMVDHCVEHVQVGAFLGDVELTEWWDDVDRDEEVLRDTCREVAITDPWRLERISDEWQQMQSMLLALADHDVSAAGDVNGP